VPAVVQADPQELAHAAAWLSVRAGLRHRDRGGPAGYLRDPGGQGSVDLVNHGVSGSVCRGHVADRYHRWHPDARRLRLGLRKAHPKIVLQHDDYAGLSGHRRVDRWYRGAWTADEADAALRTFLEGHRAAQ